MSEAKASPTITTWTHDVGAQEHSPGRKILRQQRIPGLGIGLRRDSGVAAASAAITAAAFRSSSCVLRFFHRTGGRRVVDAAMPAIPERLVPSLPTIEPLGDEQAPGDIRGAVLRVVRGSFVIKHDAWLVALRSR